MRFRAILVAAFAAALLIGCGSDTSRQEQAQELEDYVAAVQPIRLGINDLLDRADPILEPYAEGEASAGETKRRMGRLEHRAADYAVDIAEVEPVPDSIRSEHEAYAHTFVLQDTYLSTLVEAIPGRDFEALPHFQDEQRAAIIAWRTRLEVLANRWDATLPADLQIAGRGEISPAPEGD